MNILVIDDDKIFRTLIKSFCDRIGYNFHYLENGFDAASKIIDEYIDFVFLDIFMEGKEGLQTLDEIRTYCDVPIVTVSSDSFYLEISLDIGANSSLLKPISFENFLEVVDKYGACKDKSYF
jgi:CheY-like chemotaxis protein